MGKFIVDSENPETYVISKLDGGKYTRITYKHTRKHGMELSEYMEKFNLTSQEIISQQVHNALGFTLKKAINLYGEQEGTRRWKEYCDKQAKTNTFEYKKEKYGMSEEEFKKYNLNRACTLKNLIKRHGEEKGREKWEDYCKRQAYAGISLEYFMEKYGEFDGRIIYESVCKSKSLSLGNFIEKYGVNEGTKRYHSWVSDRKSFHSKISEILFDDISQHFKGNKIYYPAVNNGKEYCVFDEHTQRVYFYDYVDSTLGKCIEFNGDFFHGNPKIYEATDTPNFYDRNITCQQMWDFDDYKIKCLKKNKGFDTMVVWESDYIESPDKVKVECLKFLNNE